MKQCLSCGKIVLAKVYDGVYSPKDWWTICPLCEEEADFKRIPYPVNVRVNVPLDEAMNSQSASALSPIWSLVSEMDTYWDAKNSILNVRVSDIDDEEFLFDRIYENSSNMEIVGAEPCDGEIKYV